MFPNGDEEETEGFVGFSVDLLSLSPTIAKVLFNYNIELLETNTVYNNTAVAAFDDDDRSDYWPESSLNIDTIKDLKQLTFKLDLKILGIYKSGGTLLTQDELETKHFDDENYIHCADSFQWIINDAKTVSSIKNAEEDVFCSDFFRLHSFIWYLELNPLGIVDDRSSSLGSSNTYTELYLSIAEFPPDVSSIAFKFKLCLKETATTFESFAQFGAKCWSVGWATNELRHAKLQHFDIYTIDVTISLIDIYDIKGNVVTKDYINNHIIPCIERPICFKSEEYIWRIDDNTIDLWKKALNGVDIFTSELFTMHGLKWCMKCWPNGRTKKSIGSFKWYLYLVTLSNKIKTIIFHYNILLEETKTTTHKTISFSSAGQSNGWGKECLKTDDIQHLKSFTFKLNIKLFDVFDTNNNIIDDYSVFQSPVMYNIPNSEFIWNITNINEVKYIINAEKNCSFESKVFEIYKCKWLLELYPLSDFSGDEGICDLFLRLLALPKHIDMICVKYEFCNLETNTIYCSYKQFHIDDDNDDDSACCATYLLKTEQIKNLKSLTFKVKMSLIDLYDKHTGYPLTNDFMDDYKQSKAITLPEEYYEWKISGSILSKIKNAQIGEILQSPIFELCGFKWIQELYPNGVNVESSGWSEWYLTLISFPANISIIIFQFKIVLYNENNDEIFVKEGLTDLMKFNDTTNWWGSQKIQLKNVNSFNELNFHLEITIVEIYDNNGNKIDNMGKELSVLNSINTTLTLVDDYVWEIMDLNQVKNANNGQYFESNIFTMHELNWKVRLYPNGTDNDEIGDAKLELYLNALSNNIKSISIEFEFKIKETETIHVNFATFRGDYLYEGINPYLKTNEIKNVDELTIQVIITMIDMFDDKGNIIPFQMNDNKISNQHSMTRFLSKRC